MKTLERQLSEYGRYRSQSQAPIDASELFQDWDVESQAEPQPVAKSRLSGLGGGLLVAATVAVVVLLVGLIGLLSNPIDESEPVATVPAEPAVTVPAMGPEVTGGWSRVVHDVVLGGAGLQEMVDVIRAGPGLVAVGSDEGSAAVWTSADGVTWSKTASQPELMDGQMRSVTVGGPGLVAVGRYSYDLKAAVWVSTDGITWSRVAPDNSVFGGAEMTSVTSWGSGVVAVGWEVIGSDPDGVPIDTRAAVWTSADGIVWTPVSADEETFGGSGRQVMNSVTVGGPGLIAVGSSDRSAAVWTSVDGIIWSRVAHDEATFFGAMMNGVTAGGPGLVAVGSTDDGHPRSAAVWTSVDGLTWTLLPHDDQIFGQPSLRANMTGVTSQERGLVAVGSIIWTGSDRSSGGPVAAIWESPDGITWTRIPHSDTVFGGDYTTVWNGYQHMNAVTTGPSGLTAVGAASPADAAVWTKDD